MVDSVRSKGSHAVEKIWSELRTPGVLVPTFSSMDHVLFSDSIPFLAIVDLDFKSRTMPVKLAGSGIREFIGFEITGQDFVQYDITEDSEATWRHRHDHHDHPCGRYEQLDIKFASDSNVTSALTILPIYGAKGEKRILVFLESFEVSFRPVGDVTKLTGPLNFAVPIDIGSGVPADTIWTS